MVQTKRKPRFVFGILPVFYTKSPDNWGHQKGPVVQLPKKYGVALVQHELFHVKQWYLTLGLMGLLMRLRYFRFRFEAAAYGESLRSAPSSADHYAAALASKHYDLGKSKAECLALILKRKKDGRLF